MIKYKFIIMILSVLAFLVFLFNWKCFYANEVNEILLNQDKVIDQSSILNKYSGPYNVTHMVTRIIDVFTHEPGKLFSK